MRILVVGKGGREHALVRALAESPGKPELFCFPGSDAIFEIAKPVEADDLPSLIAWMKANAIDLCVAGEESYLVKGEGLANLCANERHPMLGTAQGIRATRGQQGVCQGVSSSETASRRRAPPRPIRSKKRSRRSAANIPTVLKFDGLAAGKGVAVCPDEAVGHGISRRGFHPAALRPRAGARRAMPDRPGSLGFRRDRR